VGDVMKVVPKPAGMQQAFSSVDEILHYAEKLGFVGSQDELDAFLDKYYGCTILHSGKKYYLIGNRERRKQPRD